MIWTALPILVLALLILFSKRSRRSGSGAGGGGGGVYMDLKSIIKEANKIGGWSGDKPPTEFEEFLGVYLGSNPKSDIPRTVMSLDEFSKLVKQTVSNRVIAQSIIAIAIREQGAERGLAFPDNNPFGFNAWKNGWKSILHLINGIFLAKDRQSWKWFLSFPSLKHAIQAMEIELRRREFDKITKPEEFVRLYVKRWWRPSNKESELEQIIQKEMRNLVSVWNRAGRYVG